MQLYNTFHRPFKLISFELTLDRWQTLSHLFSMIILNSKLYYETKRVRIRSYVEIRLIQIRIFENHLKHFQAWQTIPMDATQGQFLSGVQLARIQFSFTKTSCPNNIKEPCLFYLPLVVNNIKEHCLFYLPLVANNSKEPCLFYLPLVANNSKEPFYSIYH